MQRKLFGSLVHAAGATTWGGAWQPIVRRDSPRLATRTGGPNDDDDEAALVRKLMPILAVVIVLAVVFGG